MIIPALDILNTKIVRLYQGNYDLVSYYDYDIYKILENYCVSGVKTVHLVDLEAARNPNNRQKSFFSNIIRTFKNYIQVAGGIRDVEHIEYFLSLGVKRIVIGSSIIEKFDKLASWVKKYGNDFIVAALDINTRNINKTVCIHGWKKNTTIQLEDILYQLNSINIKHILCTDIFKDGTMLGPNYKLYNDLLDKFPNIEFQSSGGISSLHDISKLIRIGIKNIIVGKSLLENKFNINEAVKCWQNELFLV